MGIMDEIIVYNQNFVAEKQYLDYQTSKFPNKKLVVLTCMDTRLTELLPRAMNVKNGDVKLIKNAGAVVSHPFGGVMRSILVAIYALQAEEVCVVGHEDCGMIKLQPSSLLSQMEIEGISKEVTDTLCHAGIPLMKWLTGFDCVRESVRHSVEMIQNHPLFPSRIPVHGLVIDPFTGELDWIVNGYKDGGS